MVTYEGVYGVCYGFAVLVLQHMVMVLHYMVFVLPKIRAWKVLCHWPYGAFFCVGVFAELSSSKEWYAAFIFPENAMICKDSGAYDGPIQGQSGKTAESQSKKAGGD